jgi:hypothetical protein
MPQIALARAWEIMIEPADCAEGLPVKSWVLKRQLLADFEILKRAAG